MTFFIVRQIELLGRLVLPRCPRPLAQARNEPDQMASNLGNTAHMARRAVQIRPPRLLLLRARRSALAAVRAHTLWLLVVTCSVLDIPG